MRTIFKLLAGLSLLFGIALLAMAIWFPFSAEANWPEAPQVGALGVVMYGAGAGWFLYGSIRFLRAPSSVRALMIAKQAAVVFGVVGILTVVVIVSDASENDYFVLVAGTPVVFFIAAFLLYFFVLKPACCRSYPPVDEWDDDAFPVTSPTDPVSDELAPHGDSSTIEAVPTDDLFRQLRQGAFYRTIPLMLVAVGTGLALAIPDSSDWTEIAGIAVVVLGIAIATGFFAMRRQYRIHATLRITLKDERITRTMADNGRIEIPFREITRLVETTKGLLIVGRDTTQQIFVTRSLTNFELVRSRLEDVRPIEFGESSVKPAAWVVIAILAMVACFVGTFGSNDRIIVTGCGTFALAALIAATTKIVRSPHASRSFKRNLWGVGIVAVAFALRIWSVWI